MTWAFIVGSIVRHLKSGGVYSIIVHGTHEKTQEPMYGYRSHSDGRVWFRDKHEMEDGRFVIADA